MGDFNANIDEKELSNFMEENNLVDLIGHTNNGEPPRTYSCSSNRLDHILGNDFVLDADVKSGALGLHYRIRQWVDLDIKKLFGNKTYVPTSPPKEFKMTSK